jgi:hypothetical protein
LKQRFENDPKEWEKKGINIFDTRALLTLQGGSKQKRGKMLVIGYVNNNWFAK